MNSMKGVLRLLAYYIVYCCYYCFNSVQFVNKIEEIRVDCSGKVNSTSLGRDLHSNGLTTVWTLAKDDVEALPMLRH